MEIERKWMVNGWPEGLPLKEEFVMRQGYISVRPTVRIREEALTGGKTHYVLCFKSGGGLAREEIERDIDPALFNDLDQLLLGEGLMVAPVHTQNAHGRTVYLPEAMKMLRLRSVSDYDEEVLPAGRHYLPCELGEVLLFIRPGHTVPVAQPAASTAQLNDTALTFWRFAPDGQPAPYRMYTDDGVTTVHNRPEHWRIVGQ